MIVDIKHGESSLNISTKENSPEDLRIIIGTIWQMFGDDRYQLHWMLSPKLIPVEGEEKLKQLKKIWKGQK